MKKLLLSLFVGLFSFISFCIADDVSNLLDILKDDSQTLDAGFNVIYTVSSSDYGVYCLNLYGMRNASSRAHVQFLMNDTPALFDGNHLNIFYDQVPSTVCIRVNQPYLYLYNPEGYAFDVSYKIYRLDVLLSTEIPVLSSLECQTKYNLIPIESVDINYCVENELCPVNECIGSGTWSNVYINNILHPGEENIIVDIPDYIQWDYSISTGEFNIYVGSGYDMDYMNSIIKINSYRPDSEDFTNIFVSGLTLIFPYIFVLLLIIFIWKLIKRIFK